MKDQKLHANVYNSKEEAKKAIDKFKDFPKRLFELTPTESDKFDVCIIKIKGKYIAALGAKEKIKNDEFFTKTTKKEISWDEMK